MSAKKPISFAIRRGTLHRVDKLARQLGLSRSELISRILSMTCEQLAHPRVAMVQYEKEHLKQILTV